jgi:opacity protein-like surface antigen
MKKLMLALGMTCVLALAVQAQDAKDAKSKPTAEQKALRKEMTAKYDTNKDGKLDKQERAKISAEDKAKMEKAGLGPKKKKADKAE